ncbi:phosphatidate cytidylyltransferase [Sediminibacterium ginsengisoli]|uniref:Phosphatidate cytidylyltransferase n=1 Tax=Sediminibacterium ginsengisoli TaxID=413434 RepID=A0A1T4JPP6_9BACT|nr:phosphatidate cytidylyltransferase [Sediminibacterium ginsengisoli]SJZ32148.1 phosphatidate cytidylyltransferase [Sediminibacterium ginsengisoli]
MAFNFQTFKTRALTAIIFVVIMLAGLLWNQWSFLLLFSVIHFGCWTEYHKLVGLIDPAYAEISALHRYSSMVAGWGFMLWMTDDTFNTGGIVLHEVGRLIFFVASILFLAAEVAFKKGLQPKLIAHTFFGLIYISLSWGLMLDLRGVAMSVHFDLVGWMLPVIIIASIWINDTMAYIVGSFIGKTPFSPISPKKTWEGTAGGAILAVIAVACAGHFIYGYDTKLLLMISAICAVMGTLGDLLESKLKRMAGVKDSGSIMPGHGGFLDRFDSLLLATPFVWLLMKLVA